MRLAIFGGTFDPVHEAHLALARQAAGSFRLNRVLFVPAARPPHKTGATSASYEDRVRMLELACQGRDGFEVSRLEEGTVAQLFHRYHPEGARAPGARRRAVLHHRRGRLRRNRNLAQMAGSGAGGPLHRGEPPRPPVPRAAGDLAWNGSIRWSLRSPPPRSAARWPPGNGPRTSRRRFWITSCAMASTPACPPENVSAVCPLRRSGHYLRPGGVWGRALASAGGRPAAHRLIQVSGPRWAL